MEWRCVMFPILYTSDDIDYFPPSADILSSYAWFNKVRTVLKTSRGRIYSLRSFPGHSHS